jgi:60 kDa SS-A/Ro ribonucleoprotein
MTTMRETEESPMANRNLFTSLAGKLIPATDAFNEEHAPAYAMAPKQKLAQYAATGCMNSTFYASSQEQLGEVLALSALVAPEFIAKTAVYCRETGFMKDMPALLCAALSTRDSDLLAAIF